MQKISDMNLPTPPALREVVFIDSRLQDLHTILAALRPGVQAVVLNDHEDGAAQMARALQGEQGLASISVVSHGDAGVLLLGKGPLFAGNLAQHQADLQALGAALAPGGDLLLYGCNVGAGEQGAAFVAALAQAGAATGRWKWPAAALKRLRCCRPARWPGTTLCCTPPPPAPWPSSRPPLPARKATARTT